MIGGFFHAGDETFLIHPWVHMSDQGLKARKHVPPSPASWHMPSSIHPRVIQVLTFSSSTYTESAPLCSSSSSLLRLLRLQVILVPGSFPGVESKLKASLLSSSTWWQTTHIGSSPFIAREPRPPHPASSPGSVEFEAPIFLCCCCCCCYQSKTSG